MAILEVKVNDKVSPDILDIINKLPVESSNLMDDVGDMGVEEMQTFNPIGETQVLNDLTMWLPRSEYIRYIFSAAGHFDPVVDGHVILGIRTEQQRKWWFWYLNNVLGGVYDVKYGTGNKTPPNDYPSEALVTLSDAVDPRLQQFLDDLIGG